MEDMDEVEHEELFETDNEEMRELMQILRDATVFAAGMREYLFEKHRSVIGEGCATEDPQARFELGLGAWTDKMTTLIHCMVTFVDVEICKEKKTRKMLEELKGELLRSRGEEEKEPEVH